MIGRLARPHRKRELLAPSPSRIGGMSHVEVFGLHAQEAMGVLKIRQAFQLAEKGCGRLTNRRRAVSKRELWRCRFLAARQGREAVSAPMDLAGRRRPRPGSSRAAGPGRPRPVAARGRRPAFFFFFCVVFLPRPAPQFCGRRFGNDGCRHLVRVQTERQGMGGSVFSARCEALVGARGCVRPARARVCREPAARAFRGVARAPSSSGGARGGCGVSQGSAATTVAGAAAIRSQIPVR